MRHCSPCSGSPIVRRCISNATSPYAEVNRSVERLPITTPVWNLGRPMCRSTWPPINISTCVAREVARASLRVICLKWKRTRFFVSLHVSRKIYIFQRNESRWYVTIYRFQRERTHHCASLVLDEHGWRAGSWWKEDGQSLIRETVSTTRFLSNRSIWNDKATTPKNGYLFRHERDVLLFLNSRYSLPLWALWLCVRTVPTTLYLVSVTFDYTSFLAQKRKKEREREIRKRLTGRANGK